MPIYEYQCTACGQLHEALQKVSDDPLVDCPSCGKAELRKKISAVAFRLKGSGWYETDFKKDNQKNLAGDGGDKPKGDATGGDAPAKGDAAGSAGGKSEKTGGTDSGAKDSKSSAGKSAGGDSAA